MNPFRRIVDSWKETAGSVRESTRQAGVNEEAEKKRSGRGANQVSGTISGKKIGKAPVVPDAPTPRASESSATPTYGTEAQQQPAAVAAAQPKKVTPETPEVPKVKSVPVPQSGSNKMDAAAAAAAAPPITVNPDSVADYGDADPNRSKGSKRKRSKKKSSNGKNEVDIVRGAPTWWDAQTRAQNAISNANQITPADVEFVPAEVPFLYNRQAQEEAAKQQKSNKRGKRGLGKGLSEILTDEQKRQMRADQFQEYLDATRQARNDYDTRRQAAIDDARLARGSAIADALKQLNSDRQSRIDEILENAGLLNDGARKLMPGQMGLIGTTQEELEALGISDLVPPTTLYDGIPGEESVKAGDEPYLTYMRRDQAGASKDDALDWLSDQVDQQVKDRISVFKEQADESEMASFRDFANGVAPSEIETKDKRVDRLRDSRIQTQMAWLNPIRMFKGLFKADTKDVDGFEFVTATMSKAVENAISNVSLAYNGLSINSCLKLIMARGGISYDNFGKMKPKLRDEMILELCNDILTSVRKNGLPNNMVTGRSYGNGVRDKEGHLVIGGTRCFPFGYIPNDVLDEILSNPPDKLKGMTKRQVRKMEWEVFMNETYPNIFANADKKQLLAYQNGMTALLELDGQSPNNFDIPMDDEMTMQDRFTSMKDIDDPAINKGTVVTVEATHRAAVKCDAHYKHTPHTKMSVKTGDKRSGHESSTRLESTARNAESLFRAGANYISANASMNLLVEASGIPEAGLAAAENWEVNWMNRVLMERLEREGIDTQQYLPSDYLISWVRSPEGTEAIDVMNALYHLDGMGYNMVAMFQEKGYSLSKEDLGKFVQDLRGMEGKIADFEKFMSNLEHWWGRFTLGEGLFTKSDAQQWCITMLQMMAEADARGGGAGVFNAKQMEDAISRGGVKQFMTDMMFNSEIARDAFMFIGLNSFSGKNPYTHTIEKLFNVNGYTKAAFTAFIHKFPVYSFQSIATTFPMFNTVSYIVNTGTAAIMSECGFKGAALDLRNYQAGARSFMDSEGNMSTRGWLDGLRRNMMYDAVHHGNKLMLTICMYTIIGALGGLGLPDDEDKYGLLEEYRIGGPNGWPIKYAWWLDDIMGLAAPSAYAMYLRDWGAYDREGNWHEIDVDTYTDVFWNGATSHASGTAIFATIELIRDLDTNAELINQMMTDPEGYALRVENSSTPLPGSPTEAYQAFIEHYLVANTMRNVTPALMRQLCPLSKGWIFRDPEGDAHTAWSVWNQAPTAQNPSGKTKQEAMNTFDTVGVDYLEGQIRTDSQDNPLYALWNNFSRLHWGIADVLNHGANRSETGYFYDEQAIGTKADDSAMMFMDMFWLDPMNDGTFIDEDGNPIKDEGDRRVKLNEKAQEVISYLEDNYSNVDEAVADGFVLPYGAKVNAGNYCWWQYNQVHDEWEAMKDLVDAGQMSKDEYWDFKNDVVDKAYEEWIDGRYYRWHLSRKDSTIPSTIPKYIEQESDYMTYYVDKDGNPATWFDYIQGKADKKVYAYGNPRSPLSPIARPRTKDKGFNYETTSYWDIPGYTDYEKKAEQLRGHTAKMGMNKGQDLEQVYFGGQPDQSLSIPTDGSMQTTINLRNYREPEFTEIPEVLRNATKDSVEEFLGVSTDLPFDDDESSDGSKNSNGSKNDNDSNGDQKKPSSSGGGGGRGSSYRYYGGGGGGYSYYGGGGGGGGGYTPKIYSSHGQVYSDRAAGMSSRQPYKASSSYLRPSVYSSGSRKATSRRY